MIIAILAIYFIVMILIGVRASKSVKSSGDYFLGGKGAGPVLTAFRFASTFESGAMMIGTPGLGYGAGYVTLNQGFLGPLGYFFSFRVFGQRIKVCVDYLKSMTVPDLLQRRYGTKWVKILGSLAIVIGLTASIIAQLKAMGEVFTVYMGIEYTTAVLVGAVIIGIYGVFGGYLGNAFANVIQGILMLGGSIILFITTNLIFFDGKFTLFGMFPALNEYLFNLNPNMLHLTGGGLMPMSTIIALLIVSLTIGLALPQQTVALFAMKDKNVGKIALIICSFFSLLAYWTLVPSAMMATKIIPGIENFDMVIPTLSMKVLSPLMSGIFIAGLFSAIMSTASNLFLVVASALSRDIFSSVAPDIYNKKPVLYDRMATVLVIIISVAIALNPPAIIFQIIVFAFTMIAFTFVMPMLGCIYWKKSTKEGAIVSMLVGSVFIPIWTVIGEPFAPALLLAMFLAPASFILISLLTQNKRNNHEEVEGLFKEFKRMGV